MSPSAFFRVILSLVLLAAIFSLPARPALAQESAAASNDLQRGPSGLPLPRFVSLKSSRVNMRVGPGTKYAVKWMYVRSGLPLEIIQEYDNWRRVRDAEGEEGWIHHTLLSGRRTGVVAPWFDADSTSLPLLRSASEGARVVAQVDPGAIGEVTQCDGQWCRMRFGETTGWIVQSSIWGVYPGETVED
ncbi:SH3 domain-containing protein [Chelativorans sp. YIM 93263]|uniref:SH3 domain-containing protein n=1 Tax=Chelativorans sp. YIM 93263 TaxID=2906648 RepID=UPI00237811C1|nr:SH3 domain-containing protein [Chelativorans sp. YIM 93263]